MKQPAPPVFVKVCGLADRRSAEAAVRAGADYLGLVFAPSRRQVRPETATQVVEAVRAAWVGVFVDAPLERIEESARVLGLAAIQLHGSENAATCRAIRERTGRPVWKALPWTGDPAPLMAFANVVDVILLDAGGPGRGGTGDELPWSEIAERYPRPRRPVPLVLSGGLHAGNVAQAIGIVLPDGVDASSRLESAPGLKDPERVRLYVENARERSPGVVR
ncbi:MAG TPA: phosphoribosylanthranilate isomerase [Gemmatimonadota bacterium]|nr:phosphoribosylanthranilate isomerase [Gemmatimonadota bacterium]